MHSRVTAGSAGNTNRGPSLTSRLERRIGWQTIEVVAVFDAAADREHGCDGRGSSVAARQG
jgi:hypothetical protein